MYWRTSMKSRAEYLAAYGTVCLAALACLAAWALYTRALPVPKLALMQDPLVTFVALNALAKYSPGEFTAILVESVVLFAATAVAVSLQLWLAEDVESRRLSLLLKLGPALLMTVAVLAWLVPSLAHLYKIYVKVLLPLYTALAGDLYILASLRDFELVLREHVPLFAEYVRCTLYFTATSVGTFLGVLLQK